MSNRKRVDLFFNPDKEQDLIDYLESSRMPNATLIKDLMRAGIASEKEQAKPQAVDYDKLEGLMRKVIREEGVRTGEEQAKPRAINKGPLGGLGKSI